MTSNIGAGYLLDGIKEDGSISKEAQDMAMNDLRAHFRPEFLNRLDEIIMFKPLTKENIRAIIDLLVADVNRRLEEKELTIELTEAAKDCIVEGGYDPMYGARPLKRYLQKKRRDTGCTVDSCRKCRKRRHDTDRCERRQTESRCEAGKQLGKTGSISKICKKARRKESA